MDTQNAIGYYYTSGLSVTMVKVSISLPNNTQITFESEEAEVLHEIVALALRDLPRDLMLPSAYSIEEDSKEKGKDDYSYVSPAESFTEPPQSPDPRDTTPKSKLKAVHGVLPMNAIDNPNTSSGSVPPPFFSSSDCAAFEAFCLKANPLGDMRRVVVAAEGATRHFGVDGVNAAELAWLFDAAGWRRPSNFTQTLRNAARSKFGWLERIPGRSGRYAATPLGISKIIPAI